MFVIQEIHTNQKLLLGSAKGSKTWEFTPPVVKLRAADTEQAITAQSPCIMYSSLWILLYMSWSTVPCVCHSQCSPITGGQQMLWNFNVRYKIFN